jgi:hypothetical protein
MSFPISHNKRIIEKPGSFKADLFEKFQTFLLDLVALKRADGMDFR